MEEFYNKIESLCDNTVDTNLKSALLTYKKNMKELFNYYDSGDNYLKDRIINDNIFSELVFDKIVDSINDNDIEMAVFLIKKEVFRIKLMLTYFEKGVYNYDVITQDKALSTLVAYKRQFLSNKGVKIKKNFTYTDLNLNDRDITAISCMVIHEALIGLDDDRKNMI